MGTDEKKGGQWRTFEIRAGWMLLQDAGEGAGIILGLMQHKQVD
jgi:hypothetical protein